jgi:hypothetical protein
METPGILTAVVLDAALAEAVTGASVLLSLSPGNRVAATRAMLLDDSGKQQSTAHPVWEQILQLPCYSMDYAAIASATACAERGVTLQVEVSKHSIFMLFCCLACVVCSGCCKHAACYKYACTCNMHDNNRYILQFMQYIRYCAYV